MEHYGSEPTWPPVNEMDTGHADCTKQTLHVVHTVMIFSFVLLFIVFKCAFVSTMRCVICDFCLYNISVIPPIWTFKCVRNIGPTCRREMRSKKFHASYLFSCSFHPVC